jgi:hypothetical protein
MYSSFQAYSRDLCKPISSDSSSYISPQQPTGKREVWTAKDRFAYDGSGHDHEGRKASV